MRVFVTGASGFVGSAVVKELLTAGHTVLGLSRSETSDKELKKAGAGIHRGDIYNTGSLTQGAALCDAVVHTAFNHDFSKFKENCETDRVVIMALADALTGTAKPLVITSGLGLMHLDRPIVESDVPPSSDIVPRAASEEATMAAIAKGVDAYVVRLPPTTHGKGDHGFVPMVAGMAKDKGESVYIGDGNNRWPAVHRSDAAVLYRLILEQLPKQKVFHAVAETGVAFRSIAEAIGKGLNLPTVSRSGEEAEKHFTWFLRFASIDCQGLSEKTKEVLGWNPVGPNLIEDLSASYF